MSDDADFWVLLEEPGRIIGFLAMAGKKIDAMFLDPPYLRRGGGRLLVRHAVTMHGDITVDVNEQNDAAFRFYKACGFVVVGRSELDETGRPYPLLHMRLNPVDQRSGGAR